MKQFKQIIKTVNSKEKVKLNSQLRALELLILVSLDKSWGAQLPSYLYEKKLIIQQVIDKEQYSNTSSIDCKNVKRKYKQK